MPEPIQRRTFIRASVGIAMLAVAAGEIEAQRTVSRDEGVGVRLALNSYSFNQPLANHTMTLFDVVDYCVQHGIQAVDFTGYYFPGQPPNATGSAPPDEYIFKLKRKAFINGVTISGTGVRNDFSTPDASARAKDVQMMKDWIEVASKLGAPVMRVYSGSKIPDGYTFDQVLNWMVPNLKDCAEHAERHGVILVLQNHDDFIKTADQAIRIINGVDSEWFGSVLDIGSFHEGDPYAEIEKLEPYAYAWQLKQKVYVDGKEVPTDLAKVKAIIDKMGYRGFLPIETLGKEDPRVAVAAFFGEARKYFAG
ncbi:MAG TPA: sugar phosphate isomerase/epimerase family protein [Terracidiphilus sp.]|jgi:sugar phosphate isomerase/epimerase